VEFKGQLQVEQYTLLTVGFLVGLGGIFVSSEGEGVSLHVQTGVGARDIVGMVDVLGIADVVGMLDVVGEDDEKSSSSTSSKQGTGVGYTVGKGVNKSSGSG